MKLKFWEPDVPEVVGSKLNETEIKVLSRYLVNQQDIINNLTEQNQKLIAEVQVLREIVDELEKINKNSISRLQAGAVRKTSPFR